MHQDALELEAKLVAEVQQLHKKVSKSAKGTSQRNSKSIYSVPKTATQSSQRKKSVPMSTDKKRSEGMLDSAGKRSEAERGGSSASPMVMGSGQLRPMNLDLTESSPVNALQPKLDMTGSLRKELDYPVNTQPNSKRGLVETQQRLPESALAFVDYPNEQYNDNS